MSIGPFPSTFDNIHPIDLIFGTHDKLSFHFLLIETMCCLIGFHGNNSYIYDVTSDRHLGFSNFQTFIIFEFYIENGEKASTTVIGIY